jgi:ATP-dependent Clp protease ATP-binding subunit ClpC
MKILDWLLRLVRRPPALDNVSPYAQQLLVLARQEADRLFHSYAGTEHLLLALLATSDGALALKSIGIDPVKLKTIVEDAIRPGTTTKRAKSIPATPRLMQTLRLGAKEAEQLGHGFLASGHIVLGLLRLRKGPAWESLKTFGVSLEEAREKVRVLGPSVPETAKEVAEQKPAAVTPPQDSGEARA